MRAFRVCLALLALALAGNAVAQQKPGAAQTKTAAAKKQKLVMKDGSDQWVRGYERVGDRVRFYSVERDEWEEVPASIVDWKATEEANRQQLADAEKKAEEAKQADQAIAAEMMGPEVAPGIHLPDNADGVFIVENGKLIALPKQEASAHIDKGRVATNVLLPVPILKNKNLVEIPGARAATRLESSPAALFASGKAREDSRYGIARLKVKGDNRQVEAILTNILGRNPTHSGDYIELDTETIGPDTFRLVPRQALPAGEYAVVEFLGKDINLFLWDFGVGK